MAARKIDRKIGRPIHVSGLQAKRGIAVTERASPWWSAHRHADRRPLLLARARIKSAIRAWFEGQGFVEVDCGCLQVSPGNETHLHAFSSDAIGTDLQRSRLYLHTSPEFAMKKLVAAGEERIFTFAPVFRNRERGPLHAPEFTMLEWYRAGEPYEQLWEDCSEILRIAATVTGRFENSVSTLCPSFRRIAARLRISSPPRIREWNSR